MRTAVIDSTPLISLVYLELAKKLNLFFDVIYVPTAVQEEVNRKHRFRHHLRKLYRTGIFRRCSSADRVQVELLQVETELDEGEVEALVQAQEKGAAAFIGDEKRAREIGEAQGLKLVGTVRILARLNLEGEAEDTTKLVRKLRKHFKFRVTNDVVAQAIAMAGDAI